MPRIKQNTGKNNNNGRKMTWAQKSAWFLAFLIFAVIAAQTVKVQLYPDGRIVSQAGKQYWAQVPVSTSRGDIRDRNNIALALSIPATSLFIDPQYWDSGGAKALGRVLGASYEKKFGKNLSGRFLWVSRKLPREVANKLQAQEIPGLFAIKERARIYPHGSLASHIIGFCDMDDNGLSGLELAWNNALFSPPQTRLLARDAKGRLLDTIGTSTQNDRGGSIKLTLDARVQQALEVRLTESAVSTSSKWGAAICMDANTGAVIAMASYPGFDLNNREDFKYPEKMLNNAISRVYEPGSTLKPLIVGMAMEEALVKRQDTFYCRGSIAISDGVIKDSERRAHGSLTLDQVVTKSCNVGMSIIGTRFVPFRSHGLLKDLGLGEASGLDMAGEEDGLLRPPEQWLGTAPANIAIGHGLAITPLQLVTAITAIANGGKLFKPYIVAEVRNSAGEVIHRGEKRERNVVFSTSTCEALKEMMRKTVTEGTGKGANTPLAEVAGKTGTAQIAAAGGYAKGKYAASFAGFWPWKNPQYVLLVVLGEPSGGAYYGGAIAAPVFKNIVEDMVNLSVSRSR